MEVGGRSLGSMPTHLCPMASHWAKSRRRMQPPCGSKHLAPATGSSSARDAGDENRFQLRL